jgi:hypothetical protein
VHHLSGRLETPVLQGSTRDHPTNALEGRTRRVLRLSACLIDRIERAISSLTFTSADPQCHFFAHTRLATAEAGPAIVVTDVAEYEGGGRQSAVVCSAVVHHDASEGERLVVIRTHLEDQHTRHDGDKIVFEEHHDAIRAAMAGAVADFDPKAEHRRRPENHGPGAEAEPPHTNVDSSLPDGIPRVERARTRAEPAIIEAPPPSRVDLRQLAALGLVVLGVLVLLLAIANGSALVIAAGIAAAAGLGFAGNRVGGG